MKEHIPKSLLFDFNVKPTPYPKVLLGHNFFPQQQIKQEEFCHVCETCAEENTAQPEIHVWNTQLSIKCSKHPKTIMKIICQKCHKHLSAHNFRTHVKVHEQQLFTLKTSTPFHICTQPFSFPPQNSKPSPQYDIFVSKLLWEQGLTKNYSKIREKMKKNHCISLDEAHKIYNAANPLRCIKLKNLRKTLRNHFLEVCYESHYFYFSRVVYIEAWSDAKINERCTKMLSKAWTSKNTQARSKHDKLQKRHHNVQSKLLLENKRISKSRDYFRIQTNQYKIELAYLDSLAHKQNGRSYSKAQESVMVRLYLEKDIPADSGPTIGYIIGELIHHPLSLPSRTKTLELVKEYDTEQWKKECKLLRHQTVNFSLDLSLYKEGIKALATSFTFVVEKNKYPTEIQELMATKVVSISEFEDYAIVRVFPPLQPTLTKKVDDIMKIIERLEKQTNCNIESITSDGGSENTALVNRLRTEKYKKILFVHCAAHCLHLVCGDSYDQLQSNIMAPAYGNGLNTVSTIITVVRENWKIFCNDKKPFKKPPKAINSRWLTHLVGMEWLMQNWIEVTTRLKQMKNIILQRKDSITEYQSKYETRLIGDEKIGKELFVALKALHDPTFQMLVCIWTGFYEMIFKPLFTVVQLNGGAQAPIMYQQLQSCITILDYIALDPRLFYWETLLQSAKYNRLEATWIVIVTLAETIKKSIQNRFKSYFTGPMSLSRMNRKDQFCDVYEHIKQMRGRRKSIEWKLDDVFWSQKIQYQLDKYMIENKQLKMYKDLFQWYVTKFAKLIVHSVHLERVFSRMRRLKMTKFQASLELISSKIRYTYNNTDLISGLLDIKSVAKSKRQLHKKVSAVSEVEQERKIETVDPSVYSKYLDEIDIENQTTHMTSKSIYQLKPVDAEKVLLQYNSSINNAKSAALAVYKRLLEITGKKLDVVSKTAVEQHLTITASTLLKIAFHVPVDCITFESNFKNNMLAINT